MTPDDAEDSGAFERWAQQLEAYLDGRVGVEALRSRSQPHPPWPEDDNPMVKYLIDRSSELYETGGLQSVARLGGRARLVRTRCHRHASRAAR